MPTVTLVNNASIFGPHTYGPVSIPSGLQGRVIFSTVINAANLIDTTKSISFEIDSSSDGGTTWQFVAGFTWAGDPTWNNQLNHSTGLPDPGPYCSFKLAEISGKQIRARVNIPNQITLTATVSY